MLTELDRRIRESSDADLKCYAHAMIFVVSDRPKSQRDLLDHLNTLDAVKRELERRQLPRIGFLAADMHDWHHRHLKSFI